MTRRHLDVAHRDPYERGVLRGRALRDQLTGSIERYLELFALGGVSVRDMESATQRVADTLSEWNDRFLAELSGIAAGAGVPLWQILALNARTEIFSGSLKECSVVAYQGSLLSAIGAQTWDWHEEFDEYWHTQTVSGGAHTYVGLTEDGLLAKLGVNDAGLGVLLNFLPHREDLAAGVPVHVLIAAILEQAATIEEALEIVRAAPVTSSSNLTLLDLERVVAVELSPLGAVVLPTRTDGYTIHTNHFLDAALARGERPSPLRRDSAERLELIESRIERYAPPGGADDLLPFLVSDPGQPHLCCVPLPSAVFGDRIRTLATILVDVASRSLQIMDGSPADVRRNPWVRLTADHPR